MENAFEFDHDLLLEFVDESVDVLRSIDTMVVGLESSTGDKELVNAIFRPVHSIKGNSTYFGLMDTKALAHRIEDVLDLLRKEKLFPSHPVIDIVLKGLDELQAILRRVRQGQPEVADRPAFEALLEKVLGAQHFVVKDAARSGLDFVNRLAIVRQNLVDRDGVDLTDLDAVMQDMKAAFSGFIGQKEAPAEVRPLEASPQSPKLQSAANDKKTMRVPEESIDGFLAYVGELVIVREMFEHLQKRISDCAEHVKIVADFRNANSLFRTLSYNLQKSIMEIRKMPIKSLLQKAPRIIRDIGNAHGKYIEVEITGEEVKIDKSLMETLEAPFIHMVRNAADHGIEMPDVREKKGKSRTGKITVSVVEKRGTIALVITDDGKGLNYEAIRTKAVSMGLLKNDLAVTEEDIKELIFISGLSTSDTVTDVSGRGVGMDVVKRSIEAAGGKLSLNSQPDMGTEFTITLPESIYTQIIDGFVVMAGTEYYAFPLETIQETFQILPQDCTLVGGKGRCVARRGEFIPLMEIDDIFKRECIADNNADRAGIGIVLNRKRAKKVVCVDMIIGVQQIVLKKIMGITMETNLFMGGAIMGDGRVAMVVDVEKLE